ncbi:MAG: DegV family protein [Anaerolineae bacterium]|nr:DegV family protein [Anaerolineae bacterium]
MQIVTDTGMDLSPEQREGLDFHLVPLTVTLDGKSYRSGIDVDPQTFYELLMKAEGLPTTSQPAAGELATLYHQLAEVDSQILSIHISSGLSGTVNAARAAVGMAPEADVTIVDSKTLSGAFGWQVEAAARAIKAGWVKEKVLAVVDQVSAATDTLFTISDLTHLIHGGRISHMKGLIASLLNIKPVIGVEKEGGTYVQKGQARTFKRAMQKLVEIVGEQYAFGSVLRVQVMHANNLEGAQELKGLFGQHFDCKWLPIGSIAPALGAHSGPTMVGAAYALAANYPELP